MNRSAPAASTSRSAVDLVPADRIEAEALVGLFNRCYADYFVPIQLDLESMGAMAEICDVDLASSVVGVSGDAPVAVALLATRGTRGWIGGMGVAPEARGQGLGRRVMEHALDAARARALRSIDLEVLEQNTPAIRIYDALGFQDRRRLGVWARPIVPDTGPSPALDVVPVPIDQVLASHAALHRAMSPWQCDAPTLAHAAPRLRALAVVEDGAIDACAVFRPASTGVRIADLASRSDDAAVTGAAFDALLAAVLATHPAARFDVLNLPQGHAAERALLRRGFTMELVQREMTRVP